jgi:hypothetical protein
MERIFSFPLSLKNTRSAAGKALAEKVVVRNFKLNKGSKTPFVN